MKTKRAVWEAAAGTTPPIGFARRTHCSFGVCGHPRKKRAASRQSFVWAFFFTWLFLCQLLMPSFATAESAKSLGRICLSQEDHQTVFIDREIILSDGLSLRIDRYEIGGTFRYSPVGGFSSVVLSAKEGYSLLCLYVSVKNETDARVDTIALQNMELLMDGVSAVKPHSSFFQTKQERQRFKPFQIKTQTVMEGYLLFVLPDDAMASGAQLTAALYYGDNRYSCLLLPEEPETEEP